MHELVRSLLGMAMAWSGYAEPTHIPRVERVPAADMPCACKGFFLYAQYTSGYGGVGTQPPRLMLRQDVDLETRYGQSILLHEMVHLLQAQDGPARHGTREWYARERQAYRIQYRFLGESGLTYLDEVFANFAEMSHPLQTISTARSGPHSGRLPNKRGHLSDAQVMRPD